MVRYVVGRLFTALPVLFGVSIVIFTMQKLLPGDAASAILGPQATEQELTALRTELGLDQPLHVQYWRWFSKVLQGDLGRSIQLRVRITELILPKFMNTLILAAGALVIAVAAGLVIGVLSGTQPNSLFDRIGIVCTIVGASMPGFWVGLLLMYVFALKFRLLPSTGMYDLRGCSRSPGPRCIAGCASTPNSCPSQRSLWTSQRSSSTKCGTISGQKKERLDLESAGPSYTASSRLVVGRRDAATFRRLYERVKGVGRVYFTDDWPAYSAVLPED